MEIKGGYSFKMGVISHKEVGDRSMHWGSRGTDGSWQDHHMGGWLHEVKMTQTSKGGRKTADHFEKARDAGGDNWSERPKRRSFSLGCPRGQGRKSKCGGWWQLNSSAAGWHQCLGDRSISENDRQLISALSFKRGKPKARQAQLTAEQAQQRTEEGGNKLLRDRRRTGREQTENGAGRQAMQHPELWKFQRREQVTWIGDRDAIIRTEGEHWTRRNACLHPHGC